MRGEGYSPLRPPSPYRSATVADCYVLLVVGGDTKSLTHKYMCAACGRRYKQKGHLTRHQRYECRNVKRQFKCEICPFLAMQREEMHTHIASEHRSIYKQTFGNFSE